MSVGTNERDPPMPKGDEVHDRGTHSKTTVVDADAREALGLRCGTVPEGDHPDVNLAQVLEQARLVADVAEQNHCVAVARLEHRG